MSTSGRTEPNDHAVAGPPDDDLPGSTAPAGSDEAPFRSRRPLDGWDHAEAITTTPWDTPPDRLREVMDADVVLDAGWGQLVFAQTFADQDALAAVLRQEVDGRRDICLYLRDPHVFVARHPHEFFIDPSFTYRLRFGGTPKASAAPGLVVRPIASPAEAEAINTIYVRCGMVPAPVEVLWRNHSETDFVTYLVAVRAETGEVVGTVTGVDHHRMFSDPEQGTSLWCLAVDPGCSIPGVGETLVRSLAQLFAERGRAYIDLSVVHDNAAAIGLYEKLGFERVPVFGLKRKNAINEPLFTAGPTETVEDLNPYARIIADEASRRGIRVEVVDAEAGELRLTLGGRSVLTRESLSEYTSAVAMSRCDDKRLTRRIVADAGVAVPRGRLATFDESDQAFLDEVGDVVVKPVRGEQGMGITVGIAGPAELADAIERARAHCPDVLLEERVPGDDLRIIVIDGAVVAAAVRRPAEVVGTGTHTVRDLIEAQSRRRRAVTGGESRIPVDELTEATVREAGRALDDVLPEGERLRVRRTANLHTGGTIHDVTAEVHPDLRDVAVAAAEAIGIPVTGIDLLVPDVTKPQYVFIEANERPGLANHEPQPTASAFIDFLFPGSQGVPWAWTPDPTPIARPETPS